MILAKIVLILFLNVNANDGHFLKFRPRRDGFGGCTMPSSRTGQCVQLNQCQPLWQIASKKRITIAERLFLRRSRCGFIGVSPLVCCGGGVVGVNKPADEPEKVVRVDGSPFLIDDLPSNCGQVQKIPDSKLALIVGGGLTQINDSPWLTLLRYAKPSGVGFHCGGTLINKNYVLTAAHCVATFILKRMQFELISVRLGEWNIDEEIDCQNETCSDPALDVAIKEILPHEHYHAESVGHENDIALIRLAKSAPNTQWIRPICLPIESKWRTKVFDDIPMVVAGWGYTSSLPNATSSKIKLQVTLNGVSREKCNQIYRRFNLSFKVNQLCAGGVEGLDSCRGDSGSSLMYYDEQVSHWFAIGIVSFGLEKCGQKDWPGVYTRVDQYIDWILANMKFYN